MQTTTELTYEMDEPAYDLVVALRSLSPRQRAAVVLHHAADYPIREVAAILGSTPAAVRCISCAGAAAPRAHAEDTGA